MVDHAPTLLFSEWLFTISLDGLSRPALDVGSTTECCFFAPAPLCPGVRHGRRSTLRSAALPSMQPGAGPDRESGEIGVGPDVWSESPEAWADSPTRVRLTRVCPLGP